MHKVSVISRGMALGYTWSMPINDKYLHSKTQFIDELAVMLGGRVAENLVFKEITTGASNDLSRVTDLAKKMVTRFGMSKKLGPITFGTGNELVFLGKEIHDKKDYSEKIATVIDEEVSLIIEQAEDLATTVLKKHRKELDAIAARLIKDETIDSEEFKTFFSDIVNSDES